MGTKKANKFKLKILIIVAILLTFIWVSEAFSQTTSIYRIHSLFLYNFTKHVKWESTEGSTFTVGIYGNPKAFSEINTQLKTKKVWGKYIKVIEIATPSDIGKCHIAYMPISNKEKILDIIEVSDFSNTLLVTEGDLMNAGAAISFVFEKSRMKFKISKTKIEQVGLKVSSSLISVGIPV